MKKRIFIVFALIAIFNLVIAAEKSFKTQTYQDVKLKELKISPEKYKNKKTTFEGIYLGLKPIFPQIIERNSKSAKKYFLLQVQSIPLPILTKKSGKLKDLIPTLKTPIYVKLYGKIREFRLKTKKGRGFSYYFELDHIQELDKKVEKKSIDEKIQKLIEQKIRKKSRKKRW